MITIRDIETRRTLEQRDAVREIARAVVASVIVAGDVGAPGGVIYSALMAHGASYSQFVSLMGSLCNLGFLTQHGDLYRVTDAGRRFAQ